MATQGLTLPIVEIFGPTIQGEGRQVGLKTHFVRFAYCDSDCVWCDSPHAVKRREVRKRLMQLTVQEIVTAIRELGPCRWVTFTGGNPALYSLGSLIGELRYLGYKINVETQGTLAPAWLDTCDLVTLSPKPPSAGSRSRADLTTLTTALAHLPSRLIRRLVILKVPIFNDEDYYWATEVLHARFPKVPLYLSVGTDRSWADRELEALNSLVLGRYAWLTSKVLADSTLLEVYVLPQLHVLLWGDKIGV